MPLAARGWQQHLRLAPCNRRLLNPGARTGDSPHKELALEGCTNAKNARVAAGAVRHSFGDSRSDLEQIFALSRHPELGAHDDLKKYLRNAGPSKIYKTHACRKPTNTQGHNRGTVRNAGPGMQNHPRNCRNVRASDAEQMRAFLNYKVLKKRLRCGTGLGRCTKAIQV